MLVPDELTLDEAEARIEAALRLIYSHGQTDGSHHQLWVNDQILRALMGSEEDYNDWVADYEGDPDDENNHYTWDEGIAP